MTLIAACSSDPNPDGRGSADAGRAGADASANTTSGTSFVDAAVTDVSSVAFDASDPAQGAGTGSLGRDAGRPAQDAAAFDAGLATTPLDGGSLSAVEAGVLDASTAGGDAGDMSHGDAASRTIGLADAGGTWPCDGLAPGYAPGLEATGANGVQVTLNEAVPAPPIVGLNSFHLSIQDDAGNTVSGAELTVTPYMPQHHHGSPTVPESEQLENGTYRVTGVEFTMPGFWEITIDVDGGGVSDTVRLKLCI